VFGWRKKKDGFVWNEYVRTTILLRRGQRRQRVEEVRDVAVEGIKHVGRQGVVRSVAGARAAGRGVWFGVAAGVTAVYDWVTVIAQASWLWMRDRSGPFGFAVSSGVGRFMDSINAPWLSTPLLVAGAIAGASAATRWSEHGFDTHTVTLSSFAVVVLSLASLSRVAPLDFSGRLGAAYYQMPFRGAVGPTLRIGGVMAAALGAAGWLVPALMSKSGETPSRATDRVVASGQIEGRATAISGDLLKVDGELVMLSGIEAPLAGQICAGSKSCASASKTALQKLVGGKRVVCELSARIADGSSVASCQINGADIAGQLVRGGQVFALSGLFAPYSSAEREAKSAKAGIWRNDLQRPEEHRAKLWSDAKGLAPAGCPIKGTVAGDIKTYVLPWAASYDKAKVRPERGERWFCTEAEATAAGWKPRQNG
jgi:endonuclease YncB( thermonuclease family)